MTEEERISVIAAYIKDTVESPDLFIGVTHSPDSFTGKSDTTCSPTGDINHYTFSVEKDGTIEAYCDWSAHKYLGYSDLQVKSLHEAITISPYIRIEEVDANIGDIILLWEMR